LEGQTYHLTANNGANHLHGGPQGLARKIWKVEEGMSNDTQIVLSTFSEDGEEGYPGNLKVSVIYRLEGSALCIEYRAESDATTVINLTNHSYFNLDGSEDVRKHKLVLNSSHYTPTDEGQIPNGLVESVLETPLDFTQTKELGRDIDADFDAIRIGSGFDHNFVLNENGSGLRTVGVLSVDSGLTMKISTTQPAVQLYSGNHLGNEIGKSGFVHRRNSGVCLETQHFPDAPNNQSFPSTVIRKGEVFSSTTKYEFSS
jgi:aldose 1-epimerase